MNKSTTPAAVVPAAIVEDALQDVRASFERFCLTAGIATLASMIEEDATGLCGPRYGRGGAKPCQRRDAKRRGARAYRIGDPHAA